MVAETASSAASPISSQPKKQATSSVKARVRYVKPPPPGKVLQSHVYEQTADSSNSDNLVHVPTEVNISDIRGLQNQTFDLLVNGFLLVNFNVPTDIDWETDDEVKSQYYPLAADLLKQFSGGSRVHVFDHTLRLGKARDDPDAKGENLGDRRTPASRVHTDYTTEGGVARLKALLPDEAETLMRTPFAIYQVWRPLKQEVEESPLGFIDAATVDDKDLNVHRIEFPGRTGYNYALSANPEHRWYYTKAMRPDEAYVFVEYDSRKGRARFTPHTAFKDPTSAPDAPPRESVELRALVFWEHDSPQAPALDL